VAAARTLNRANSVISYAIANLEAQLGFPLFDRESTRKPQLTAAGRSILAETRTVSDGIAGLRVKARSLADFAFAQSDARMQARRMVTLGLHSRSFSGSSPANSPAILWLFLRPLNHEGGGERLPSQAH
jgi:hypothetical protein